MKMTGKRKLSSPGSDRTPSVSVVMPVYNVENYINESVSSILNQTFPDFEFIIIDDGSTDKTWEVLQSFKDKRIKLLRNEHNMGNYPSRNKAIKIAKGKYTAVMDGDDIAMPDRLEKQYLYLETHGDLIALGTNFILTSDHKNHNIPLKHEDIYFALLKDFSLLHPSFMIVSDVLLKNGGYNEKYRYASDYDLLCRLSLMGKIENLSEVLMKYRRHEDQISHSKKQEQGEYAYTIRRDYQIAFVNRFKPLSQEPIGIAEVGIPEVGLAISFYTYGKSFRKKEYHSLGDRTIDVVYKIITKDTPACIQNGLCGLGCGLQYLIKNGFLDGEIDEILDDIDHAVLHAFNTTQENHRDDILYYIDYRISKGGDINEKKKTQFTAILNNNKLI